MKHRTPIKILDHALVMQHLLEMEAHNTFHFVNDGKEPLDERYAEYKVANEILDGMDKLRAG